ncbi:MAG: hypothetical protein IKW30_01180 [Lachnospiraceae bacterium]|nr:hypothetical protein [Lachnospiraceae bacterium]
MRQKRGKVRTLLCSFIPGAAEMYMGFMKTGISLMTIFVLCFVVPSIFRFSDVFILFGILAWFYSFFHARNLASYSEEEFHALADEYVWNSWIEGKEIKISNPTLRKWGAVILIVFGASQLWNTISHWIYSLIPEHMWNQVYMIIDEVPQIAVAIVIIVIGCKLIAGKKEELNGEGN